MMAAAGLCTPLSSPLAQPAATATVVEPAEDLRIQAIRPDLNVILGAGGNVVVWSGADGIVLIDSGVAAASAVLTDAVGRIAPGPVRFVINTHGHADHAGGNEAFARMGAVLIGHESLRENGGRDPAHAASGSADGAHLAGAARPLITLTETLALHLNGDRLDLVHVADAHTGSDIVLRWNDAEVIALGDIYRSGQYPQVDIEAGGSLAGVVAAVEGVLARANSRTVVVPGHGPVSNRAELAAYRDMLVAVGRKLREATESGMGIEEILASRPTAEFDTRYARPGASVTPEEFVRSIYRDLAPKRPGR
jgi:glyoxylase-like metal-dependent hydrolase (beta-lactamase superfamily II)